RRGNDLVRRYLWMAGLSAVRCNAAVRALHARVVAKHPDRKAIAIGHAMRKLLHLAFAVWKTDKPFDPGRYARDVGSEDRGSGVRGQEGERGAEGRAVSDTGMSPKEPAAGLTPGVPAKPEVTAAGSIASTPAGPAHAGPYVDFGYLKKQLPMARVLDQPGLALPGP